MDCAELRKRLIDLLADDPEIAEVAECDVDDETYLEVTDTDGDKHCIDVGALDHEDEDDDEDLDDDE
jgi:hypothetical protein